MSVRSKGSRFTPVQYSICSGNLHCYVCAKGNLWALFNCCVSVPGGRVWTTFLLLELFLSMASTDYAVFQTCWFCAALHSVLQKTVNKSVKLNCKVQAGHRHSRGLWWRSLQGIALQGPTNIFFNCGSASANLLFLEILLSMLLYAVTDLTSCGLANANSVCVPCILYSISCTVYPVQYLRWEALNKSPSKFIKPYWNTWGLSYCLAKAALTIDSFLSWHQRFGLSCVCFLCQSIAKVRRDVFRRNACSTVVTMCA